MALGKLYLLLSLGLLSIVAGTPSRKVSAPVVNSGCSGSICQEPWVVHVKAEGTNDTIHHIWGVHAAPTFLLARTDPSSELSIDWDSLSKGKGKSLKFEPPEEYSFGFVIPNIILFNDANDTGKIDGVPSKDRKVIPMSDFEWTLQKSHNESSQEAAVVLETRKFRKTVLPSDIRILIQMAAYGVDGRSTVLPHLLRTPDSAQFDIVLDHLFLNISSNDLTLEKKDDYVPMSGFAKPRWALELLFFSSESLKDGNKFVISKQKSLDDENTPGVFHLDEMTTNMSRSGEMGGYLQWRPVSYLSDERDIGVSTFPNFNDSLPPLYNISIAKPSLAFALLGDDLLSKLTATTSISFGQRKDNFYTGSNYTTWTVAMGLGTPPQEEFSTMVIIVMAIGVGIPVLMFIAGISVLAYRKFH